MAPDEIVVLLSIAYLRLSLDDKSVFDDCFNYDYSFLGKAFEVRRDESVKYITSTKQCYRIMKKLAMSDIIEIDFVEEYTDKDGKTSLRWNQGYEWSCSWTSIENIEFFYGGNRPSPFFVHLSVDGARAIVDEYAREYEANLYLKGQYLEVQCGEKWYQIKPILSSASTYDIIHLAMSDENINNTIAREKIINELGLTNLKNKSLKSDVFRNNPTVNDIASPFIRLESRSIHISRTAFLTENELKKIIDSSK